MRTDVHQINSRINLLERSLAEVKNDQLRKKVTINIDITVLNYTTKTCTNKSKIVGLKYPKWWPFAEISPTWFILMLLWPFVAQRLINAVQRKKWPRTQAIAIQQQQQQQQETTDDDNNRTTNDIQWKFTCANNNSNHIHCLQGRCHRRRYFLYIFVNSFLQLFVWFVHCSDAKWRRKNIYNLMMMWLLRDLGKQNEKKKKNIRIMEYCNLS